MWGHASHGGFCSEEKRFLSERRGRILLRKQLKLGLGVREVLPEIIRFCQLHSDIARETGTGLLVEKLFRELNHGIAVGAGGVLQPDREIPSAFFRCRSRS